MLTTTKSMTLSGTSADGETKLAQFMANIGDTVTINSRTLVDGNDEIVKADLADFVSQAYALKKVQSGDTGTTTTAEK